MFLATPLWMVRSWARFAAYGRGGTVLGECEKDCSAFPLAIVGTERSFFCFTQLEHWAAATGLLRCDRAGLFVSNTASRRRLRVEPFST
jgi:hypothetical protein